MARKTKTAESSSEPDKDEVLGEPANEIDPYEILVIEKTATQDQIKTAYRKAALKHHPDKAQPAQKDEANKKFQEIATAYAVLSDEKRRRRYDTTGNTAESLDDDDFNWTDFFREQSQAMVDGDMIEKIKREYQGSQEERDAVFRAYEDGEGDMDYLYEMVLCSNVIDDDERFRGYIDEGIKEGNLEAYAAYANEGKEKKRKRLKKAKGEEQEALELAEQLGVKEKLFGRDKGGSKRSKKKDKDEDALKTLIQQRQKSRSENFLDQLEAKYGGGQKSKRKARDEPPEELFQQNSKKSKGSKRS